MQGELIIFRGLPGSGKSYIIKMLIQKMENVKILSRDDLRNIIIPHPSFSEKEKKLIDEIIYKIAKFLLEKGEIVIIDGMSLSSKKSVDALIQSAKEAKSQYHLIECECSETTALKRIKKDMGAHPAKDRNEKLYYKVKKRFEYVHNPKLTINTELKTEEILEEIMNYILK